MVGDDQESGVGPPAHLVQHIAEPGHVGVVQRCVDLVEDADRRRVGEEHRKDQRQCRQRLLAPGKERQGRQLLARRLAHDLKPGIQGIVAFDEDKLGLAAAEQVLEKHGEIAVHLLEGRQKPLPAFLVQACDA